MTRQFAVLALCACALSGCSREPTDRTPGGALTLFLRAMDRSQWDADARAEAYRLLHVEARGRLQERAAMASSLAGREFQAWEMIPQGRFGLKFHVPSADHMQAEIEGDHAVISIFGASEGEVAQVPMVREGGAWRVQLDIPALPGRGRASDGSPSGRAHGSE